MLMIKKYLREHTNQSNLSIILISHYMLFKQLILMFQQNNYITHLSNIQNSSSYVLQPIKLTAVFPIQFKEHSYMVISKAFFQILYLLLIITNRDGKMGGHNGLDCGQKKVNAEMSKFNTGRTDPQTFLCQYLRFI
ncbi:hypothetical protein R6Q59_015184 [Mikania micrantha]